MLVNANGLDESAIPRNSLLARQDFGVWQVKHEPWRIVQLLNIRDNRGTGEDLDLRSVIVSMFFRQQSDGLQLGLSGESRNERKRAQE
jgi:hypothetical protein